LLRVSPLLFFLTIVSGKDSITEINEKESCDEEGCYTSYRAFIYVSFDGVQNLTNQSFINACRHCYCGVAWSHDESKQINFLEDYNVGVRARYLGGFDFF